MTVLSVWWCVALLLALAFLVLFSAARSAAGSSPVQGVALFPVLCWFLGSFFLVVGGDLTFEEVLPPSLTALAFAAVGRGVFCAAERFYFYWAKAEGFGVLRESSWSMLRVSWALLRLSRERWEILSTLIADSPSGSLSAREVQRALRAAAVL